MTWRRALAPDAPKVHAAGNLQREMNFSRGDSDAAWGRCAHIVENTYVTPRQMHAFMETEGGYAVPEADGTLSAVRRRTARRPRPACNSRASLALPEHRIRVVTSPTGGAFGGKDELTVQPALALLVLKCGRPVRLHLDRAESVARPDACAIRCASACGPAAMPAGRLLAQELDLVIDLRRLRVAQPERA